MWSGDLQPYRKSIAGKPTRNRDGRQPILIEWRSVSQCEAPDIGDVVRRRRIAVSRIEGGDGRRGYRRCRCNDGIHRLKRLPNRSAKTSKVAVGHDVVDRAYVRSTAYLSERGRLVLFRFFRDELGMIRIRFGSDYGAIGDVVQR